MCVCVVYICLVSLTNSFRLQLIKGASAVLLCYAIHRRDTLFQFLTNTLVPLLAGSASSLPLVLVGLQEDLRSNSQSHTSTACVAPEEADAVHTKEATHMYT